MLWKMQVVRSDLHPRWNSYVSSCFLQKNGSRRRPLEHSNSRIVSGSSAIQNQKRQPAQCILSSDQRSGSA